MKIIILMILSGLLYAVNPNDNIIMLKITPNFKAKKIDFEMLSTSLEMNLTANGYQIINEQIQKEALEEQKKQQKSDCYDDKCLVDTGRMLAARKLLMVNISKRKKTYFIKFKKINIETGLLEGSDFIVIDIKYDDKEVHNRITKIIKVLFPKKEANNIENLVTVDIETIPNNAIVKIDGELMKERHIRTILSKGVHEIEISKEYYKKLHIKVDIKSNSTLKYKLKPLDYQVELSSDLEKVSFHYAKAYPFRVGADKDKKYLPYTINTNIENKNEIIVCKKGYKAKKIKINSLKKKLNIKLDKRVKYRLNLTNKKKYKLLYEEKYNYCGNIWGGELKNNMLLPEGNYQVFYDKPGYVGGARSFIINEDNQQLTILKNREISFDVSVGLISEFTKVSDDISERKHLHTGIVLDTGKLVNRNMDFSAFTLGLMGDFFYSEPRSIVLKFGVASTYFRIGWLFTQVNFFGIGGDVSFQFYDGHILVTPLSFKLGMAIPLGDFINIRLYGNASWVTEWFEDGTYENDGTSLTGGAILEFKFR